MTPFLRERPLVSTALRLFLILQGMVLLLDVSVGLVLSLPALVMEMPVLDILKDWGVAAALTTLVSIVGAGIAVCAIVLLDVTRLMARSRTIVWFVDIALFAYVASAAYRIYVLCFSSLSVEIFGISTMMVIPVLTGIAVVFLAERYDSDRDLSERLASAGKIFCGIVAASLVIAIFGGVGIAEYPHTRPAGPPLAGPPQGRHPNFIIVISDALRASAMSVYGEKRTTTPHIDDLARTGAVVTGMTAVGNFTVPTTATLLTGVEPFQHRAVSIKSYLIDRPGFARRFALPQALRQAGYDTAAVVANLNGHPLRLRLASQFQDVYTPEHHCDPVDAIPIQFTNTNLTATYDMIRTLRYARVVIDFAVCGNDSDEVRRLSETYGDALNWLDERNDGSRPFLLWVHTMPPHAPYLPPKPFLQSFDPGSAYTTNREYLGARAFFYEPTPGHLPPRDVETLSSRYLENVRFADDEFGKFFEALRARGLLGNTVVVLLADHGESFRRWIAHDGPYLDQDLIEIPFIVWSPGQSAGLRVNQTVSEVDLAPTILALAGVTPPAQMTGRSLVPLLQGHKLPDKPVFATQLSSNAWSGILRNGTYAVIDGHWKYVQYLRSDSSEELFDLARDKHDSVNLAQQQPAVVVRLRTILEQHFAGKKRPMRTTVGTVRASNSRTSY